MAPEQHLTILAYHRVAAVRDDRWRLAVSPEHFDEQMRELALRFRPVALSDRSAPARDQRGLRRVAVTFDDGYEDNLTTALPILRRWCVPATFFICGDGARFRGGFWWDWLNGSFAVMRLGPVAAARLHCELAAMPPAARDARLAALPAPRSVRPSRLRPEQVARLAADPRVEIAAHGWSHQAFAALSAGALAADVRRNADELEAITGRRPRRLAYPFGSAPGGAGLILRRLGIRAAYTIALGTAGARDDPFAVPRLQIGDWPGATFGKVLDRRFG